MKVLSNVVEVCAICAIVETEIVASGIAHQVSAMSLLSPLRGPGPTAVLENTLQDTRYRGNIRKSGANG